MRRHGQRWLFLPLLTGGIAAFAGFWYAATGDSAPNRPAFGGTYVEGVAGAPARVNPLFASENSVDAGLVALVFSGLTRLDEQGRPVADLAERWDVGPDGRTYTFRLRAGLQWQDGARLTADDVLYTLRIIQDPALRSPPPLASLLAGATLSQIDAQTVSIELLQPDGGFAAYLSFGILPRHLLDTTPAGSLYDSAFNQHPVGSGPFRLDELGAARAVLAPNPGYHLGQPFIQRLELRFFRDDGTLLAALRSGSLDGAFFSSGVGGRDLDALRTTNGLRVSLLPDPDITFVFLNLQRPKLQDRRVRQALYYAIDRSTIADRHLPGQAVTAASPLPRDTWPFVPALQRYGLDLRVAAALLDDAGWRLDPAGHRVRGGEELSIDLATNSDPVRVQVAGDIARAWRTLGIRVQVDPAGTTSIVRDLLDPRDFDAVLFAARSDADLGPYALWHSSQAARGGRNFASFADGRADRLLADARLGLALESRAADYREFQELFAQELPALPLYESAAVYVQKAFVQGTKIGYIGEPGERFWQVQDWYVKTRK